MDESRPSAECMPLTSRPFGEPRGGKACGGWWVVNNTMATPSIPCDRNLSEAQTPLVQNSALIVVLYEFVSAGGAFQDRTMRESKKPSTTTKDKLIENPLGLGRVWSITRSCLVLYVCYCLNSTLWVFITVRTSVFVPPCCFTPIASGRYYYYYWCLDDPAA